MRSKIKPNFIKALLIARPKLEEREIKTIINALPTITVGPRVRALPNILQRWFQCELIEHSGYGRDSEDQDVLQKIRKLKDFACKIKEMLSTPKGDQLRDIIYTENWEAQGIPPTKKEFKKSEAKLNALLVSVGEIEIAASQYITKKNILLGDLKIYFQSYCCGTLLKYMAGLPAKRLVASTPKKINLRQAHFSTSQAQFGR